MCDVRVTLIDAANPFVFVDSNSIATIFKTLPQPESRHAIVESIRRLGAVEMGLASTVEVAAKVRGTPKIAILYPPIFRRERDILPDIRVQAYSMGLPHPSLQLTGAVCLAAAVSVPGTVAADLSTRPAIDDGGLETPERTPSPSNENENDELVKRDVVIEHNKGNIPVTIVTRGNNIISGAVSRTARRLLEGKVWYYIMD